MQPNRKSKQRSSPMTPLETIDPRPKKKSRGNTQQIISSNNNIGSAARNKKNNNNRTNLNNQSNVNNVDNTNNTADNNNRNNTSNSNNGTTTNNYNTTHIPNSPLLRQTPPNAIPVNPNQTPNLIAMPITNPNVALVPVNPPVPHTALIASASVLRAAVKAHPDIFIGCNPNVLDREHDEVNAKVMADYRKNRPHNYNGQHNAFNMGFFHQNNRNNHRRNNVNRRRHNNVYNYSNVNRHNNVNVNNMIHFHVNNSRVSFSAQSLAGKGYVATETVNGDIYLRFEVRGRNGTDTHLYNQSKNVLFTNGVKIEKEDVLQTLVSLGIKLKFLH